MDVKKTNSTSNVNYTAESQELQPETPKQPSKGISGAQDSFEKLQTKGSLLIDLTPEEIQQARKGIKPKAAEPEKTKESEFSKKAKEVVSFVGNAAQEALMQWAGKGSPIPLPPTPPDADTGKNMHNGVTILKELNNRNYQQHVDDKGGNSEKE